MAKKLNNENPIDKLFREGMEQRQFVYEEKFWENAETVLSDFNKAADKKRYGWWFGGGIVAVVTIISVFFVTQLWQKQNTVDNPTIAQSGQTTDHTVQQTEAPASKQNTTAQTTIPEGQESSISTNTQTTTASSTFTHPTIASTEQPAIDQAASQEDKSNTGNQHTGQSDPADIHTTVDATNTGEQTHTDIPVEVSQENQTEIPVAPIEENQIAEETGNWEETPGVSIALTQGALPPKNLNTTRVQWFAGIYAGTQRSYAHFGSGPQIWINHVEKAQEPAFSPTISLEGGLRIKPFPLDMNLSVNFMQMGEDGFFAVQRSYLDTSFTVDSHTEMLIDTIYVGGEPLIDTTFILVNDTTWSYYANDSTEIRQVSNRLYYAEIPMMFGYTYQHNKWSFRLSTGPSIGILHKRAGYYPNDMLNDFDALEELNYFNDIVWYWRVDPAVGYALSPSVSLQCRGTFRAQISDTYNADDRSLRYITHGLLVGLRYTFTGN